MPADYDGYGSVDVAVYRATSGTWYVLLGSTGGVRNPAPVLGSADHRPIEGAYVR